MKKVLNAVVIISSLSLLSSCASQEAYNNYLAAKAVNDSAYYAAVTKPLLDVTLPAPDGKEYKIVVNREVKPIETKQIKDSEWTGLATATVVGATLVAGKGFDWKIRQSDNEASVDINDSDNRATTEQVKNYVTEFKKESIIETIIPMEVQNQ